MRRRRMRWAMALTAVAFVVGAVPGAAEAATRWVAKDGKAGPTSCNGTRRAAKTIQAAIDASAAGDVVVVCPGTYRERIVVGGTRDDLTIRSSTVGGAIIRTPSSQSNLLFITGVDDVVVSGFRLQIDTVAPCTRQNQVVLVDAGAVRLNLAKLTIEPRGSDTAGVCGFVRGVQVVNGSKGTIKSSTIRDPQLAGVFIEGNGSKATVVGSTIRFLHATATYPGFCNGSLIHARLGATMVVRTTTLIGRDQAGASSPLACAGVNAENGAGTAVVKATTIGNVNSGIQLVGASDHDVSGVAISKGRGTNGHGIFVSGAAGGSIKNSSATGMSGVGIWLTGATTGFLVESSDARGNAGFDCRDDATGPNTWTDVKGTDPTPPGICVPS